MRDDFTKEETRKLVKSVSIAVGFFILKKRQEYTITLEELASSLKTSKAYINSLECRRAESVSMETIVKLSQCFNVPVCEVLKFVAAEIRASQGLVPTPSADPLP